MSAESFAVRPPNVEIIELQEVYSPDDIQQGVTELTTQLVQDFPEFTDRSKKKPILDGIKTGGVWFLKDVERNLIEIGANNYRRHETRASSYGDATSSSGKVALEGELTEEECRDSIVFLIDDCIETGETILALKNDYEKKGATVYICTVVDKRKGRSTGNENLSPDYAVFKTDNNDWLEGYGMGTGEFGRTRPNIIKRVKTGKAYFESKQAA